MQLRLAQEAITSQICFRQWSLVFDVIFSNRSFWFYFPPTQLPVDSNNAFFTHFPLIEIQVNLIPQIRNNSVDLAKVLILIYEQTFPNNSWNLKHEIFCNWDIIDTFGKRYVKSERIKRCLEPKRKFSPF